MSEINYQTEKSWRIKESLPIKCTTIVNRYGDFDIEISKMSISYDTFVKIFTSLSPQNSYGISYDYTNGEAKISVTKEGLIELERFIDVIQLV